MVDIILNDNIRTDSGNKKVSKNNNDFYCLSFFEKIVKISQIIIALGVVVAICITIIERIGQNASEIRDVKNETKIISNDIKALNEKVKTLNEKVDKNEENRKEEMREFRTETNKRFDRLEQKIDTLILNKKK